MCYNIAYYEKKIEKLQNRYNVSVPESVLVFFQKPVYHASGFSHPNWPVISAESPKQLQLFNWGLIPPWIKSQEDAEQIRQRTLNCVSETAFEKPSFRNAIKKQRCIIPVTAFFEWQTIGVKKYPYVIQEKHDEILSLAGIYENWTDKETGEIIHTFSILTCPANDLLAKIHNSKKRMPVILLKENENEWLNTNLSKEEIHKIIEPVASDYLKAHTISKLITSRTENPDSAEVLNPFNYPEIDK